MQRNVEGHLLRWNAEKHFGFIQPHIEGYPDGVFVHRRELQQKMLLAPGDEVTFDIVKDEKRGKVECGNVKLVRSLTPQKAYLMKWVEEKGFGFAEIADSGLNVFVHARLFEGPCPVDIGGELWVKVMQNQRRPDKFEAYEVDCGYQNYPPPHHPRESYGPPGRERDYHFQQDFGGRWNQGPPSDRYQPRRTPQNAFRSPRGRQPYQPDSQTGYQQRPKANVGASNSRQSKPHGMNNPYHPKPHGANNSYQPQGNTNNYKPKSQVIQGAYNPAKQAPYPETTQSSAHQRQSAYVKTHSSGQTPKMEAKPQAAYQSSAQWNSQYAQQNATPYGQQNVQQNNSYSSHTAPSQAGWSSF